VQVDVPLVAAKVYRPRMLRNLKNDNLYRAGRTDIDSDGREIVGHNEVHAMVTRTAYGESLRHQSWIAHEFQTLKALSVAGADVPRPYEMAQNAILMDYVGDETLAAPTLNSVDLEPGEAQVLFDRVLCNIDLMLANERIHGDLSAYNILYWEGDITLIDFPQVVPPEGNPMAWRIFERDVTRICEYFDGQGLGSLEPRRLATELWTAHGHRVVKAVHPRNLDPDKPEDRRLWEQQK